MGRFPSPFQSAPIYRFLAETAGWPIRGAEGDYVEPEIVDNRECYELMQDFIRDNDALWNEDIGEKGDSDPNSPS